MIEDERSNKKAQVAEMAIQQSQMSEDLFAMDKTLRNQDKERTRIVRDWERKIELQKEQVSAMQQRVVQAERELELEQRKIDEHAVTKTKNAELARLTAELEAIERNNNMLKIIELQY